MIRLLFSAIAATVLSSAAFSFETISLKDASWIWHPASKRDNAKVVIKTEFSLKAKPTKASIAFACDNFGRVLINGSEVARQSNGKDDWRTPTTVWDLSKVLRKGKNIVEAECGNNSDIYAGFIATIRYEANGVKNTLFTNCDGWTASKDSGAFVKPSMLGRYGCGPWNRFADDICRPIARMREIPSVPAYESVWISAQGAPMLTHKDRSKNISAPGTSCFISKFTNEEKISKAEWTVSGLGVFEIFVNGTRIGGDDALKPGFTHAQKTKYYFTYDVTDALKKAKGEKNILAAEVSAGWWRDKIVKYHGKESAFRGELFIEYANGKREVRTTNTRDWLGCIGGPVWRAAIFDGEIYDSRVSFPSDGDATLKPVVENREFRGGIFKSDGAEIVRRFDLALKPVEAYCWKDASGKSKKSHGTVIKTRVFDPEEEFVVNPGETLVVDFGQNAAAVPHFKMKAKSGTVLTCLSGEMMNEANGEFDRGNDGPSGSVYRRSLRIPNSGMRLQYTFNDSGAADYYPRFTFFGYRYISVTATDTVALKVVSIPITSITKEMETGTVETGVKDVNKLISNIYWGQLSNYLSVPTDCPQRNERLGWTADTQVFAEAGSFNADTSKFLFKWMRDMRDSQHYLGSYPGVAPSAQYGGASMRHGWADAGIIVPYQMWKQFGDTSIIDTNWESMSLYMKRCAETKFEHKAIAGECGNYQWSDWLSYEPLESHRGDSYTVVNGRRSPKSETLAYWDYLGACYWMWDARQMSEMAKATGRVAEEKFYSEMAEEALAYIRKSFFTNEGKFKVEILNTMQTPALFALKLGILENEQKERMVKALRKNIADHGDCLQTGFLGTSILMETLSEVGLSDVAYTLLLQHKNPSWLYSIDQGATTIWERWNSYTKATGFGPTDMNSFNHYAYGAVLAWIYKTAAGIAADPENPGFKNIIMAPIPDRRLGFVKAQYKTKQGTVKSHWRFDGNKWIWNFTVPANSTATVKLPGESGSKRYQSGSYSITLNSPAH
jgi:alpha-L-rhamnosidase